MADFNVHNLRDCAILATINIFGLSYFSLFSLQILTVYFPSFPGAITTTLSVIFLSAGVILWCSSSLIYRAITAFQDSEAPEWGKIESGALLLLIWASTIPAIVLLFESQPWIQLSYVSVYTLIAIGNIVDFLVSDSHASAIQIRFPYYCVFLGLLSVVPAIHAFAEKPHDPSPLAIAFGRMVIYNALGGAFFLFQPLERIGITDRWRPSLYIMHLVLVYNMVSYSRVVLETALASAV
jgi:predicted membrane channel-forming protein YqfA (hemolysin III family)